MNNKEQLNRFKETARKIGADVSNDALDKIMENLDLRRKSDKKSNTNKEKPAD